MARLDADGPASPVGQTLDRRFPARASSVAEARHLVTDWLRASLGGHELMVDNVALAVSAACMNAVRHAYRGCAHGGPEPTFDVVVGHAGSSVTVTVSDHGSGMVSRPDSAGLGLGLRLIDAVTDAVDVRPPSHGTGTIVAMRFSAADAGTRAPLSDTFSALAAPPDPGGEATELLRLRACADLDGDPMTMQHATDLAERGDPDYRWLLDGLADGSVMQASISVEADVARADGSRGTHQALLRGVWVETGPIPYVERQVSNEAAAALPAVWQQLGADIPTRGGLFIHVELSPRLRQALRYGPAGIVRLTAHDASAKEVWARVVATTNGADAGGKDIRRLGGTDGASADGSAQSP